MTDESIAPPSALGALRGAFDSAFASPHPERERDVLGVLAVRIAGRPMAMRAHELRGLVARRKVMPLPGAELPLLGIVGLRGRAVPVFTLAPFVGSQPIAEEWKWLALAGGDATVALAFEELDAYVRLSGPEITPLERPEPHIAGVVRVAGEVRPTLDILSIVASLSRGQSTSRTGERTSR